MVMRVNRDLVDFDPYFLIGMGIKAAWTEKLIGDDWTLNPTVFAYTISFRPSDYVKGYVAESWEFTDPSTYVVHLRQGIHWQDIPPANGREFTASDVVYHYHRMYGGGDGFTKLSPSYSTYPMVTYLQSVSATGTYTVVFSWKTTNAEFITETMDALSNDHGLECPDAVKLWGDLNDWHHAIGTGPFILKDFVSGSSATLVKNNNYWGYDERYPQNKLPYLDGINVLIMPDNNTALAALRTGKIDVMSQMPFSSAQSINKTNPEILTIPVPKGQSPTVDPKNNVKPFNDIKVRQAMQMAIDIPSIANNYYAGTVDPYPASLTSKYMTGYGFPYPQWPQDLKDQYAYNAPAAKQLLADAGYSGGFKTDVVADNASDLTLLQIVQSYFADVGIIMEIRTMDSAAWSSFVRTNKSYDQLFFAVSGTAGFVFEPMRQLSFFETGMSSDVQNVSDPVFDTFDKLGMAATTIDELKQVLKDANERVARQHFIISLPQPNLYELCQPWLKGYSGQTHGVIGASIGPVLMGFYCARFWVDQNLKSSMGY